ncbi:MAG: hypothetical protein JWQ80_2854 [Massilia sp.]|nr:hypothetical protein [Massilia sp.]
MRRESFMLALTGLLFSTASLAAEPDFCHSVCDSERRACKANVQQLALEDGDGLINMAERNQNAKTAAKTQSPSPAALAGERASVQARRIQRSAACDETYQRCARACKASATATPVFPPRKSG